MLCLYVVLVSHCQTVTKSFQIAFYFPQMVLALSIFFSSVLTFAEFHPNVQKEGPEEVKSALVSQDDQDLPSDSQHPLIRFRFQFLLQHIITFLVLLFTPFFMFPEATIFGTEESSFFYLARVTPGKLTWCCLTGLFSQIAVTLLSDLVSNHYMAVEKYHY